MSCEEHRIQISAGLDGSLDDRDAGILREHLRCCRGCREFREEMRQMSDWMAHLSADAQQTPPAFIRVAIGERISRGSAVETTSLAERLAKLLRAPWLGVPQWAYGLSVAVVAVLCGVLFVQMQPAPNTALQLAALDAYERDVAQPNPYESIPPANPYLDSVSQPTENPYQDFIGGGQ